jgi:nitroreductase
MTEAANPAMNSGATRTPCSRAGRPPVTPIPARWVARMLAAAARAPSVHNTQPWRFDVTEHAIELYADPARKVHHDAIGRQMLISCGAALFGLRLAVRELGRVPAVTLLPDPVRPALLARVAGGGGRGAGGALGPGPPATDLERRMLAALPHRHTHRGAFDPGPLPAGLLASLQHDALAEGAKLALVDWTHGYPKLAALAAEAAKKEAADTAAREEILRWSREPGRTRRDGVPAEAFAPAGAGSPGRLAQRDFDLGRRAGLLPAPGPDDPPPAATAVLITAGDLRIDWLRAGQALHRVLAHAAMAWVFASLNTEPLEYPVIRDLIRARLALPGVPQMLLQFGLAKTSLATPRRTVPEALI